MAAAKKAARTRVKRAAAKPVRKRTAAPASSGKPAAEDRKLLTLRLTYAQRRHLQRIAFDAETSVQEWIVAAIEERLRSKGMPTLDSVKA
jgi:hypothetical protein